MKRWRRTASVGGDGGASPPPSQALVTHVAVIDSATAEFFWNVDVLGTPSDGDLINGTTPGGGTTPGSQANSFFWNGSPGDVQAGFTWQIVSSTYDGSFSPALPVPDQSGTI